MKNESAPTTTTGEPKRPVRTLKEKTVGAIADHPLIAEVVAATLVAAAAALRNPKKARQMAVAAADDLTAADGAAAGKGSDLWELALEVARRSIAAIPNNTEAKSKQKKVKKDGTKAGKKDRAKAGKKTMNSKKA